MQIRKIDGNTPAALDLIQKTFLRFEAPDYSAEGIKSFESFIGNEEQMARLTMYGAYSDDALMGIIAARDEGRHICLFFVDEKYQRKGIGRMLWEYLKIQSKADKITVNSSPYAVEVYHRLGFKDLCEEQLTDGMRYTPMEYVKPLKYG